MAGNSTKDIKRHQKSIGNTQKITKAMEIVSAVKMRKSQLNAIASRPYAQHSLKILQEIALINKEEKEDLPELRRNIFFNKKSGNTTILIIISPDKGLVGGLNSNLLSYTKKIVDKIQSNNQIIKGISVGEKSSSIFSKLNIEIIKKFKNQNLTTQEEISELVNFLIKSYKSPDIKQIKAIYTEFFSTIKQSPTHKEILPINIQKIQSTIDDIKPTQGKWSQDTMQHNTNNIKPQDYIFEPNIKTIIKEITPFLINIILYNIILEATASEHSSRMIAMRNASQNAEKILEELTLSYNKARQKAITQEIAEVSSGAEALTI